MSSSVCVKNRGADHRANSAASYASDRLRQALRITKIRIRLRPFINEDKLSHQFAVLSLIPAISSCKPRLPGFSYLVVFLSLYLCLSVPKLLRAEHPGHSALARAAVSRQLAGKLTADYRTTLQEKPLRQALDSLAFALQVNFWLDRRVDPTMPVAVGPDCRTAFQVVDSLASSVGLQAIAVKNVILVGRGSWVEQTAGLMLADETQEEVSAATANTVSWPDLTTPTKAVSLSGGEALTPLPHDLWPAVQLNDVSSKNAVRLIAAQFDLMPSLTIAGAFDPLKLPEKFSASYPHGPHATDMRRSIAKADSRAIVKDVERELWVVSTLPGHLEAIRSWLGYVDAAAKPAIDIDKVRFTLRIENAIAEQVFKQLASTADRRLVIDEAAAELCKKLVTLTAADATLRTLCDDVARSIGTTIRWTEQELNVLGRDETRQ